MRAAVTETHRELALPGGRLRYTLRRTARARTLRVTIHPELGVVVAIPPSSRRGWAHAEPDVERFLAEREPWLRRHLARHAAAKAAHASRPALGAGRSILYLGTDHLVRFAPTDERSRRSRVRQADGELVIELSPWDGRSPASVLEAWLRDRAREAIDAAIQRHAPVVGAAPTAVTLRDPRSRWGSCSRKGRISLSWRLILAPPAALESVVVHELCHLQVFGHGPRFRALLASRIPDHATWRRWLHVHAGDLHTAVDGSEAAEAA